MHPSRTSVLLAPVLILLLFASTLVGLDRLGFRDVSHFYTPLYDYIATRVSQQWLPLWNPNDQTGMPLIGETSTAVLYPVRYALFSLPISTDLAISWYVALHLIFASLTAFVAARWTGASHLAAAVASIVYPLSGSVLFLYTNPTFLVGAAWLPLVLGVMIADVDIPSRRRTIIAGVSLSMMILGGDPQTALHAVIIVGAVWLSRLVGRRSLTGVPWDVLIAAPLLAAVLAAPQIVASISWSRQSDRIRQREVESLTAAPIIGGKRYEAFQYSLPPWHALELATPNAFGSLLPTNRRISQLIPGDGRMWTPSIYMGVVVMLALLCRLRRQTMDPWMITALMSLWLAMGHFGVVWIVQAWTSTLPHTDSAVGGPYWWLYQFLPGYDSFRYPAKWLTPFAISAAMVTAQWVDHDLGRQQTRRVVACLLVAVLVLLSAMLWLRWNPAWIASGDGSLPVDEFWGPLNVTAGISQILVSLVHSLIVLLAIGITLRTCRMSSSRKWVVAIVALDLTFSGYGLISRVSRESERELIAGLHETDNGSGARWLRTQSRGGWPVEWKETSDDQRLVDVEASVRAAWFGRWHLAEHAGVLNNMVSIRSHAMAQFWASTRQAAAGLSPQERDHFWASIRRWLSIDGVIHATEETVLVDVDGRTAAMVQRTRKREEVAPRLRVHWNWKHGAASVSVADFTVRLREIASSASLGIPLVQSPPDPLVLPEVDTAESSIRLIGRGPESLEAELRLPAPGLVTRSVYQDGHWLAEFTGADTEDPSEWKTLRVHRVDGLIQGVLLPAGHWRVRFWYAPWWLGWSLGLAAVAWILVAVVILRDHLPMQNRPKTRSRMSSV